MNEEYSSMKNPYLFSTTKIQMKVNFTLLSDSVLMLHALHESSESPSGFNQPDCTMTVGKKT